MNDTLLNRRILHGGDYNPEQWLNRPDILKRDIEFMKQAHINCVSVGIFSWSSLEPEEGHYTFGWLKEIIDCLYQNHIYTILATPSGARPVWMAHKYPEVLRVDKTLHRNRMGGRHNHCYTSPVYREKVWEIDKRLAETFGNHPGVLLWHISNEYGGACYCPLCQAEFRKWLQRKYGTLDALNQAWWTSFWSHTYTDWEQIEAPGPRGEELLHGLVLDWYRFVTSRTVDFCTWEKKAIRAGGSNLPVTTNLMGFYYDLDYSKFKDVLDIASWDNYPNWRGESSDVETAIHTAMTHDLMRCIKHKPFLMMESTPSQVNWRSINRLKAPGMHELASLQAVAHGSNSVQYFQWRQSRGASEKFHGAVVDHYGGNDTRVFQEVTHVGKRLESLSALCLSNVRSQAAILFDRENEWALDAACGPRNGAMHYEETIQSHYQAFWRLGINVDLINETDDLTGYKLVIAPMLYLHRDGIADKLRRFVSSGGTLVGTYWSGLVDENDLCFEGPTPGEGLTKVYGLRSEEIDGLRDEDSNHMFWNGKLYELRELCELVHIGSAKTLAVYSNDFYAGKAALTVNHFGEGRAYFLAARAEDTFYCDFYRQLTQQIGVCPSLGHTVLPEGITAGSRFTDDGKEFIAVQNFTPRMVCIPLEKPLTNLENCQTETSLTLPPYGVRFLTQESST